MKVEKGQLLRIEHKRKGVFVAEALQGFDSEKVDWFPVVLAQGCVQGGTVGWGRWRAGATEWAPGDEIPCRASLARIIEVL